MRQPFLLACVGVLLAVGTATAAAQPDPTDTPREAVARTYIDALVSHDASAVPFAPDATRVELGVQTGFSGPQLTDYLEHNIEEQAIQRVRDVTMTEDGDTVTTQYYLEAGLAGAHLATVRINEEFVVPDGTIHYIHASAITPVSG